MFQSEKTLILASQSPRRRTFLHDIGLTFDVIGAEIEEVRGESETPETFVSRMALEKARCVSTKHPDAWVISADTIVYIGDTVYAKPQSKEDGVAMLLTLSGNEHRVMTAFCLANQRQEVSRLEQVLTRVRFCPFNAEVATAYVNTGEGFDKAGGYGIQGLGGCLVERISGSYSNVVGLPLAETLAVLQEYGVVSVR